ASGFGFAIAAPATIGFMLSGLNAPQRPDYSIGYVNVLGFTFIAVLAFFTVPIGAKLAHKLSQRKLKLIFGICLLLICLNMARKALA
ncbi:MAG: TSUP family transporter, partial [Maricaulaceae bacterium]